MKLNKDEEEEEEEKETRTPLLGLEILALSFWILQNHGPW
jgi:hypothetical protein